MFLIVPHSWASPAESGRLFLLFFFLRAGRASVPFFFRHLPSSLDNHPRVSVIRHLRWKVVIRIVCNNKNMFKRNSSQCLLKHIQTQTQMIIYTDFIYNLRLKSQAITNENLRVKQVPYERTTVTWTGSR